MEVNPKSRRDEMVVQQIDEELLIYDLKANRAFCLNETLAQIWQRCDGTKTVADLVKIIRDKSGNQITTELIWLAIDQLKRENLLSNGEDIRPDFQGLSRRQMIRKVGLNSMVALPVIASLVAPNVTDAQSMNCSAMPLAPNCVSGSCRANAPAEANCTPSCNSGTGGNCVSGMANAQNCVLNPNGLGGFICECVCI